MNKGANQEIVKAPYSKTVFANETELQHFFGCCNADTGYLHFMDNFFYIQHPTQGAISYHPYEYQTRLINTYHNFRFSISLMPRQTGKTTSAAGYLLWYAMFIPDSTILIAANVGRAASEIMTRIRYAYENCPDYIRCGVVTYNKGSIEFENGSRIVSTTTTETTGRGMSISLLYLDEFAFVRPTIAEEFWSSITPTLSTGGKCIITSTPNSDEDKFAELWKGANKCEDSYGNKTELGVNGFRAFQSHWSEMPGRDEAWAVSMQAQIGMDKFRREYGCEFLIADETLITASTLLDLEGVDPLFKHGEIRWYSQPVKSHVYVITLDPSLGTGGDNAAIQVYDATTTSQIAEWKHNRTDIPGQIRLIADISKYISEKTGEPDSIYYTVENNSIGEAALISLREYGEHNIPGMFMSENGRNRRGFTTTSRSKLAACAKFKTLLESRKLKIYSRSLISELKTFIRREGSYAAKVGEKDDLVMSSLLAIRVFQQISSYHLDIDSNIRDHESDIEPMPFFAVIGR